LIEAKLFKKLSCSDAEDAANTFLGFLLALSLTDSL